MTWLWPMAGAAAKITRASTSWETGIRSSRGRLVEASLSASHLMADWCLFWWNTSENFARRTPFEPVTLDKLLHSSVHFESSWTISWKNSNYASPPAKLVRLDYKIDKKWKILSLTEDFSANEWPHAVKIRWPGENSSWGRHSRDEDCKLALLLHTTTVSTERDDEDRRDVVTRLTISSMRCTLSLQCHLKGFANATTIPKHTLCYRGTHMICFSHLLYLTSMNLDVLHNAKIAFCKRMLGYKHTHPLIK